MEQQLLAVKAALAELAPGAAQFVEATPEGYLVMADGLPPVRCHRFGPTVELVLDGNAYQNVKALDRATHIEFVIGNHM